MSRFAMARVTISWCFFIFESSFLPAIIRPEEAAAKAPPTPPSGIAAGRPTIDKAEARLADESRVENAPLPAAIKLVVFFARLYFSQRCDNGRLLHSEPQKPHLLFAF